LPGNARAALPAFVANGSRDRPIVALTFHGSGDVALLDRLLAVAATHRAPLTIFAVGQWLDANPAIARRVLDAGHELANHTYTHPALGRVGADAARREVQQCRDALIRHAAGPGKWFRPSGVEVPSATILAAAAAAGYSTVVGYDVDPRDYQDPGAAVVRARVAAGVRPGAIVSLHTGHLGTVDALAGILDDLDARGLRPVTVSGLLL
jgi:peptidoglycan/xylan/chitin deacetylase (PgdA/CDA1 family)